MEYPEFWIIFNLNVDSVAVSNVGMDLKIWFLGWGFLRVGSKSNRVLSNLGYLSDICLRYNRWGIMKEVEKLDSYKGMQEKVIRIVYVWIGNTKSVYTKSVLIFMNSCTFYYGFYKMGREYSRMVSLRTCSMHRFIILAIDFWLDSPNYMNIIIHGGSLEGVLVMRYFCNIWSFGEVN